MIHSVFVIDITDDGMMHGHNDGTHIMKKRDAKFVIAFLLSEAKKISQAGNFSTEEMFEIQQIADYMIDNSKEVLN